MKRIGAFFLAFILAALSIFIYYPSLSFAADDVTVIPRSSKENFSFSSSDAHSYVEAHKDIYSNDNVRLFIYDPGASYNWTLGSATSNGIIVHFSDNQLKNMLMTSNNFSELGIIGQALLSNSSINRSLMIGLGCLAGSSSDTTKAIIDTIYGNYNYLNAISYDETTQTITMDSSSVDALREEIKTYYYDLIGMIQYSASGKFSNYINSSIFSHLFEYDEDYGEALSSVKDYKFALADFYSNGSTNTSEHAFLWNNSDYIYLSDDLGYAGTTSTGNNVYRLMSYNNGSSINLSEGKIYYYYYGIDNGSYCTFNDSIFGLFLNPNGVYYTKIYPCLSDSTEYYDRGFLGSFYAYPVYRYVDFRFYSFDGSPLLFFKSYSALYNYINGDQTAYLSSQINQTGQDITFSINDMNENLGSKMDELIDSINSGKASMSQDELQKAIDSGLEELNKNTEEIKDNTAEMNNKLDELIAAVNQGNDTLLEILGVTEYIAYSTTKDDGTSYTFDDLFFTFGSIYDALGNAILYGVNTLDSDGASVSYSSSAYSSSAYSLSSAALLSDDSGNSGSGGSFANSSSGNSGSGGSVGDSGSGNSGSGSHIDFEYRNGLFGHFPFSVPYQLYEWLQVLKATPKCPEFTYNYGFLIGHKDEEAYSISFDLSAYQDWADNCKSFLRLSFTLFFAVGVFKKLKGVM